MAFLAKLIPWWVLLSSPATSWTGEIECVAVFLNFLASRTVATLKSIFNKVWEMSYKESEGAARRAAATLKRDIGLAWLEKKFFSLIGRPKHEENTYPIR